MKNQQVVQFAVMCLEALDANAGRALSLTEISRSQGVPLPECTRICRRFDQAGIVQFAEADKVILIRPVEDLTALEILEALWAPETTQPEFRMLVGGSRGPKVQATLQLVARTRAGGFETNG